MSEMYHTRVIDFDRLVVLSKVHSFRFSKVASALDSGIEEDAVDVW